MLPRRIVFSLILCVLAAGASWAQGPRPFVSDTGKVPRSEEVSVAERLVQLKRTLEQDRAELSRLRGIIDDPSNEYRTAEAEYQRLVEALEARRRARDTAAQNNVLPSELAAIDQDVEALRKKFELSKERWNLAFEEDKSLKEKAAALEKKVRQQEESVAALEGTAETAPAPLAVASPPPADPAATSSPTPQATAAAPAPAAPTPSPTPMRVGIGAILGVPTPTPAAGAETAAPAEITPTPTPTPKIVDAKVVAAEERVAELQSELESAEAESARLQDLITAEQLLYQKERELRDTARKQEENANKTVVALEEDLAKLDAQIDSMIESGAPSLEVRALREAKGELSKKIEEERARRIKARSDVRAHNDAIDRIQEGLAKLYEQRRLTDDIGIQTREALEKETKRLELLKNPLNPRNIYTWIRTHGLRLLLIVLFMFLGHRLTGLAGRYVIYIFGAGERNESDEEWENRKQTLSSVFSTTGKLIIDFIGIIMILQEIGVPVAPLLGGAAVGGLAVAFGAQNLIRDYFTGFVILLENQYQINDVVRICETSGLVERITLRMTQLRDMEGTVHFIPNGEIKTVSNLSHGWSRAVLDIGVAYKEDADNVIQVLKEVGRELRDDPEFSRNILEDLTMLGVNQMADSAIVIKCFIKTKPLQQWSIRREMLRRIKKRFDELGIEIPFPHRTVFVRHEGGPASPLETLGEQARERAGADAGGD